MLDRAPQRILVDPICGRSCRPAIDDGSYRNGQPALGNVLMNSIVGKARQRAIDFVHMHFGFVGFGRFREAQNVVNDRTQLAFREQSAAARGCDRGAPSAFDDFAGRGHSFGLMTLQTPCRFEHSETATATHHAPSPSFASAALYRNSACPTKPTHPRRKSRRTNSKTPS